MANDKKLRRQQRALDRLEAKIEIDGLGFARSPSVSENSWSQEREHHRLRDKLGLIPKGPVRMHPSDSRNRIR